MWDALDYLILLDYLGSQGTFGTPWTYLGPLDYLRPQGPFWAHRTYLEPQELLHDILLTGQYI